MTLGKTHWVIAEGYIPATGPHAGDDTLRSHETACILNTGPEPAKVSIHIYFKDRDPAGPYEIEVAPRRTLHLPRLCGRAGARPWTPAGRAC